MIRGQEKPVALQKHYNEVLLQMKSNRQFPQSVNFPDTANTELPKKGRHADLVQIAKEKHFGEMDLFVDCSASKQRPVECCGAVPCLTPTHPVYSLKLQRYLGAADMLNAQGLWESVWSERAYKELLEDPAFAQALAGNSFASTVCQAVSLASMVVFASSWGAISLRQAATEDSQACILRRIHKKRSAPEYSDPAKRPARKKQGGYKRKYGGGVDGRKRAKGKKEVASIWDKEQLHLALGMWVHSKFTSLYIYITSISLMKVSLSPRFVFSVLWRVTV